MSARIQRPRDWNVVCGWQSLRFDRRLQPERVRREDKKGMNLLWLGIGLGMLLVGADGLVRGASKLAPSMRITPLAVGLTVVAFGTSSPELAVSLQAAFRWGCIDCGRQRRR